MRRREFMTLIAGLAIGWPLASYAQQPQQPLKRVGVLAAQVPCPLQPNNLVVRRLGELGWIEGQNILIECVSTFGPWRSRELTRLYSSEWTTELTGGDAFAASLSW
jgi:hypothetical protein